MTSMTQEWLHSSEGHLLTIRVDFDTLTLHIGDDTHQAADRAELDHLYRTHAGAILVDDDAWLDMDNAPARLRDLAAWQAHDEADDVEEHPALDGARELLDEWPEDAADALCFAIALDVPGWGQGDDDPPMGTTRLQGHPDLPPELAWPGPRHFVAQLDLAQLSTVDVQDWLPTTGRLWLFVSEDCTDNVVLYSDAPTETLVRTTPPAEAQPVRALYTRHDARPKPAALVPIVTTSPWSADELDLPEETLTYLREHLHRQVEWRGDPGNRCFGDPSGEMGWDVYNDPEPAEDPLDPAGFDRPRGTLVQLLQLSFSDGFLYLRVELQGLRAGDVRGAELVYWGT